MSNQKAFGASELKASFPLFVLYVWTKVLGLPKPTTVQWAITRFLEEPFKTANKMVQAFRGVGKSFLTAAYVCWRLWKNPELKVMVVSATGEKAVNFSTQVMAIIENASFLAGLRPSAKTKRWSTEKFDVIEGGLDQSPSVKSVGINGQVTGTRADLLIMDDVEIPGNSATPAAREKIMAVVDELMTLVLKPDGEVIVLGTPQSQDTIYNKIKATKNIKTRVWPIVVPTGLDAYKGCLAPEIELAHHQGKAGAPTDDRFPEEEVTKRRGAMSSAMWSLQMMLDPELTDADKFPLKLRDLVVTSLPMSTDEPKGPSNIGWCTIKDKQAAIESVGFPKDYWYHPIVQEGPYLAFDMSVMFVDPAGRGKDELAFAVVKCLNGVIYLTRCEGHFGGPSDSNLDRIVECAKQEKVKRIYVENNLGGGAFTQLLKPRLKAVDYAVSVEDVTARTQKEIRILDTLEPVVYNHRLVVLQSVVEDDLKVIEDRDKGLEYSLFYQFTRLTRERGSLIHDDRLDAVAGAVAECLKVLAINPGDAHKKREQEELERFLSRFKDYPSDDRRNPKARRTPFRRNRDPRMGTFGRP